MRLMTLIFLFFSTTIYAQQYYWGFGLLLPVTNHSTADFKYLSDSPFNSLPYPIESKSNFLFSSYNLENMFLYNFEFRAGMQRKSFFYELNVYPFSTQELGMRVTKPVEGEYSVGIEEIRINQGYAYTGFNILVKHNLFRRSTVKYLPYVGAGAVIPYNYYLMEEESFGYFKFENNFYPYLRAGFEFYPVYIFGMDLRYTYQLTPYMDGLRNVGYIEFAIKTNFFINSGTYILDPEFKKDQIYLGE